MAQKPTPSKVKRAQQATDNTIARKIASQKKLGKNFDFGSHGPGVIPEKVWKELQK